MQHSVISWETIHEFGPLWWDHLKMRKRLFVDEMGWKIPHTNTVEVDQYDNPLTHYIITHVGGKPIASSRLTPCNGTFGGWSYMIKDACAGKLEGIPKGLMANPPTQANVWEATRFAVDPGVALSERNAVLELNAKALASAAGNLGASSLIALMPPGYIRWLRSIGLSSRRAGPTVLDGQNKRICAIVMQL